MRGQKKKKKKKDWLLILPVILVTNFVFPRSKAATRQNIFLLEIGQHFGQGAVTLEARGGIAVVKATDVCADNFIIWLQQVGIDQSLDAVGKQSVMVDGLVRRLGDFKHN